MEPKSVHLFLEDGTLEGCVEASVENWTGWVYKISRSELFTIRGIDEIHQAGVYILFGTSPETGKPLAYVGQASRRKNEKGILGRLKEHNQNWTWWTDAIAYSTKDNSWEATELNYYENKFYNLALEAGGYSLHNACEPSGTSTNNRSRTYVYEQYLPYARLITKLLGYNIFEPVDTVADEPAAKTITKPAEEATSKPTVKAVTKLVAEATPKATYKAMTEPTNKEPSSKMALETAAETTLESSAKTDNAISTNEKEESFVKQPDKIQFATQPLRTQPTILYLVNKRGAAALGFKLSQTSKAFRVCAGSRIALKTTSSMQANIKRMREEHVDDIDEKGILQRDLDFASSSAAASFVAGSSESGPKEWQEHPLLYIIQKKLHVETMGQQTADGFMLKKGSKISLVLRKSAPERVLKLREKFARKVSWSQGTLKEDILFKKANQAAEFAVGGTINACEHWKTKDGIFTYNDLYPKDEIG